MKKRKDRTIRLVLSAYKSLWVLRLKRIPIRINAWFTRRLVALYKKHFQVKELALNNRKIITLMHLKIPVEFRLVRGQEMLRAGTTPFVAMLKSQKEGDKVAADIEAERFLHASRLLLCECAVKPRIIRSGCIVNPGEISIDDCSDEEVSDASTQLYERSNIRYFGTPERPNDRAISIGDLAHMQEVATLFDRTLTRYGGLKPEDILKMPMDQISQITGMMDTALSAYAEAAEKAKFAAKKDKN